MEKFKFKKHGMYLLSAVTFLLLSSGAVFGEDRDTCNESKKNGEPVGDDTITNCGNAFFYKDFIGDGKTAVPVYSTFGQVCKVGLGVCEQNGKVACPSGYALKCIETNEEDKKDKKADDSCDIGYTLNTENKCEKCTQYSCVACDTGFTLNEKTMKCENDIYRLKKDGTNADGCNGMGKTDATHNPWTGTWDENEGNCKVCNPGYKFIAGDGNCSEKDTVTKCSKKSIKKDCEDLKDLIKIDGKEVAQPYCKWDDTTKQCEMKYDNAYQIFKSNTSKTYKKGGNVGCYDGEKELKENKDKAISEGLGQIGVDDNCNGVIDDGVYNSDGSNITDHRGHDSFGYAFYCTYTAYGCKDKGDQASNLLNCTNNDKTGNIELSEKGQRQLTALKAMGLWIKDGVWCKPNNLYKNEKYEISDNSSLDTEYYTSDDKNGRQVANLAALLSIYDLQTDVCDGLDNNLDGKTDKEYVKTDGTTQAVTPITTKKTGYYSTGNKSLWCNAEEKESTDECTDGKVGDYCGLTNADAKGTCKTDKTSKLVCTTESKKTGQLLCKVSAADGKNKKESCSKKTYDKNCNGLENDIVATTCYAGKGKKGLHCNPKGVYSCNGKKKECVKDLTTVIETTDDKGEKRCIGTWNEINLSGAYKDKKKGCLAVVPAMVPTPQGYTTPTRLKDGLGTNVYRAEKKGLKNSSEDNLGKQCKEYVDKQGKLWFCGLDGITDGVVGNNCDTSKVDEAIAKGTTATTVTIEKTVTWYRSDDPSCAPDSTTYYLCCNNWYKDGVVSCNGRDDNCNGKIDENWKIGKSCRDKKGKGIYQCSTSQNNRECSHPSTAIADACPENPFKTVAERPEDCGTPYSEIDSDGDMIPDYLDECPNNPHKSLLVEDSICGSLDDISTDSDGDGVPDYLDGCAYNKEKTTSSWPYLCGDTLDMSDTDKDGIADYADSCPQHADKASYGVCGCEEADSDINGNNIADCMDPDGGEGRIVANNDSVIAPFLKVMPKKAQLKIRMEYHDDVDFEVPASAAIKYQVTVVEDVNGNVTTKQLMVNKPVAKVAMDTRYGVAYSVYYRVIVVDGDTILGATDWSAASTIINK